MKITLSKTERLILSNQYKILHQMFPNQSYDKFEEVLTHGYSNHYDDIFQNIYDEPSESYQDQVMDVLSLYDALQRSVESLGTSCKISQNKVTFPGYDGNNETELRGYVQFLQKNGQWDFVKTLPNANSHCPMVHRYSNQISKWKNLGEKYDLSESEIEHILAP